MSDDPNDRATTTTTETTDEYHTARTEHHDSAASRAARWTRDATVPIWSVLAGAFLIVGMFSLIVWRIEDTRRDTERADQIQSIATCANANEFRQFLGDFLESQGAGSEFSLAEVPGFDTLSPTLRAYLTNLDSFIVLGREEAKQAAAEYRREFPTIDCRAALVNGG